MAAQLRAQTRGKLAATSTTIGNGTMSNNLVKTLCVLALSTSSAIAKAGHHHESHHRHTHNHHGAGHHQTHLPQDDLTCMANTAYREARGNSSNMQAVASVAKNRLLSGWGENYCQVIRKGRFVYTVHHPEQSEYNKAFEIAKKVMADELPDNTGGAMYFHADYLRHKPKWAKPQYLTARIGGNVFYRDPSTTLRVAENTSEDNHFPQ